MSYSWNSIDELSESIAYETGCILTGISYTKVADGWRIMLKVTGRDSVPMVSFTFAPSVEDGIALISSAIHSTSHTLKWKKDKWS